ncbi:hypothetical protein IKA92_04340 [bacterium]|nr:hypothetical protein [bacterium]
MKKNHRVFVSHMIKKLVVGEITTLFALSNFPKDYEEDESLDACFLAIAHFEADEDLRNKNIEYKEAQDEYMMMLSEILDSDEDLPQNIIQEYKNYYKKAPIYKDDTINNVKKRLMETLNITD